MLPCCCCGGVLTNEEKKRQIQISVFQFSRAKFPSSVNEIQRCSRLPLYPQLAAGEGLEAPGALSALRLSAPLVCQYYVDIYRDSLNRFAKSPTASCCTGGFV
jgi:hypothetical protein